MDISKASAFIDRTWSHSILPQLVEYVRIPNKSPIFDREWETNGHMEKAVQLMRRWAEAEAPAGSTVEVLRIPGRTPVLMVDVPGDVDEAVDMHDIDPDLLRSALAAKLSSSGLAGADQAAFMESLMQMMSGEGGGNPDDILETLTSTVLNQASQGGADSSTARWLSGQGVSLEEDDEEDDEGDHKDSSAGVSTYLSPQDSVAAEKPAVNRASTATKATASAGPETSGKKRKQVAFEAPASQLEGAVVGPEPINKRAKKATTDTARPPVTVPVPPAKASKKDAPKSIKAAAPTKPTSSHVKASKADTSEASKDAGKEEEAITQVEAPKQTRKRKATTEAEPEEKPKRQNEQSFELLRLSDTCKQ